MTAQAAQTNRRPVLGIDLGGTNLQAAVVDGENRILGRSHAATQPEGGPESVVTRIIDACHAACVEAGVDVDDIRAVGIVAAGAMDIDRGVVLSAPNLGWSDFPLRDELGGHFTCPVVVENDVNGAAWAEARFGAGKGATDALAVWVGTGVGGGLVLNGRIYHGSLQTAGEIGHTVIDPNAPDGERTVEDRCSRMGMSRMIHRRLAEFPESLLADAAAGKSKSQQVSTSVVKHAVEAGDDLARIVVEEACELLGIAIANQVTMLSFETVVVGGGVTETLEAPFVERIRASFLNNVFPERCRSCRIEMTALRENAGLLGAADLAATTGTRH